MSRIRKSFFHKWTKTKHLNESRSPIGNWFCLSTRFRLAPIPSGLRLFFGQTYNKVFCFGTALRVNLLAWKLIKKGGMIHMLETRESPCTVLWTIEQTLK